MELQFRGHEVPWFPRTEFEAAIVDAPKRESLEDLRPKEPTDKIVLGYIEPSDCLGYPGRLYAMWYMDRLFFCAPEGWVAFGAGMAKYGCSIETERALGYT